MSINQLMLRNLKKNLKNYYLYVFALIFSVAVYFSFVTLQYDPAMDEAKGSIKGAIIRKIPSKPKMLSQRGSFFALDSEGKY